MNALEWHTRRGRFTNLRPTLWLCTGCLYSFWSHGDEQDPDGDGHCQDGHWVADMVAIYALTAAEEER